MSIYAEGRHESVKHIAQYFEYEHLPEHLQPISGDCASLAQKMLDNLPDSPELAVGLRKLMEAKDCFVRAALALRSG